MNAAERYEMLERQLRELLEGESDFIANAGNFAALIRYELPDVNWAGFYLADESENLVLGPFSGRPACTRIAAGRGICGAAAQKRATLVVDDVEAFADHIACDVASRSEIVLPILKDGVLFGVFDVDSPSASRFAEEDRVGIERLVSLFLELNHLR
ncbi:MAG TPA: GAF domain-containing protein [Candidatus Cybelea sp.]|jgi:GAF domain-containing protein|nr:GAF domain-containing protein [Candidatus Cybelea sp.]